MERSELEVWQEEKSELERNGLLEVIEMKILYNNTTQAWYTGTVNANLFKTDTNLSLQGHGVQYRTYDHDNTTAVVKSELTLWTKGTFDRGLQHGKECETYFSNGKIQYTGNVFYDKKEGEGKLFHFNGCLSYKGIFKNDMTDSKHAYETHKNGKITYRGNIIKGNKYGFAVVSYNNGQIKYAGEFESTNPKNGKVRILRRNGKLGFDGDLKNGLTDDSRWYFLLH